MKTILIVLIIFLITLIVSINAQSTFQKTFGGSNTDAAGSVLLTKDGGYIIAGNTSSYGEGSSDIYLIKTNSVGDTIWTRTFGGSDFEACTSIALTSDGGFILTGSTKSFGAGNLDVILLKVSSSGSLLWSKTFGGIEVDFGNELIQTQDGGFLIAGETSSYGSGGYDAYIIKTDQNGNPIWSKTFGGVLSDGVYSIQQTNDNGFVIVGYTRSFGSGVQDVLLLKTDQIGNLIWSKTFGAIGSNQEVGHSIKQTRDNGYVICGYTNSYGAGGYDVYLIKTNSFGLLSWSKTYGGSSNDKGYFVNLTSNGGLILTGETNSFGNGTNDGYIINTDSIGNLIWSNSIGGVLSDALGSSVQTPDNGFIISGFTSNFGSGNNDVFLIKTDSDGNSGCNQTKSLTIVNSPNTLVSSPPPLISTGFITSTPNTKVGSGGKVNEVCKTIKIDSTPLTKSNYLDSTTYDFGTICSKSIIRKTILITNTDLNNISVLSINKISKKPTNFWITSPTNNLLPQVLTPSSKFGIVISFNPLILGKQYDTFQVKIKGLTDISFNFVVSAFVQRGELVVAPTVWDFKSNLVNNNINLDITLFNNGSQDLKIVSYYVTSNKGSFYFNNFLQDINISPGITLPSVISVRPRDTGFYSGLVCLIISQPCLDTFCIPISGYAKSNGTGLLPAIIDMGIPVDVKGIPRSFVSIPLTLEREDNIIQSKARTMHGKLRVRSTLLVPFGARSYEENFSDIGNNLTGTILSSKVEGDYRIVEFEIRNTTYPAPPSSIGFIDAQVLLGDTIHSNLTLDTLYWTDGNVVKVSYRGGLFTLDGFCPYGGNRYISNSLLLPKINFIAPNIVRDFGIINFTVLETEFSKMNLFNSNGGFVKNIFNENNIKQGVYEYKLDVSDLTSGNYYLELKTPTTSFVKNIRVVK
jgi:hypothetical protein